MSIPSQTELTQKPLLYPKTLRRYLKAKLPEKRLMRGCTERFNFLLSQVAEQAVEQLRSSEYRSLAPQDVDRAFAQFSSAEHFRQQLFALKSIVGYLQATLAEVMLKINTMEVDSNGKWSDGK